MVRGYYFTTAECILLGPSWTATEGLTVSLGPHILLFIYIFAPQCHLLLEIPLITHPSMILLKIFMKITANIQFTY